MESDRYSKQEVLCKEVKNTKRDVFKKYHTSARYYFIFRAVVHNFARNLRPTQNSW